MTSFFSNFSKFFTVLICAFALTLAGCARDISPDNYEENQAGVAKAVYPGTIVNAREVQVTGGDKLEDNTLGLIVGGAAGGIAGSTVGSGSGSTLAAVAGALLGAAAGGAAEGELKKQPAMEYIVELDNGRTFTLIQGTEPRLDGGQKIFFIESTGDRGRVVPKSAY